VAVLAVGGVLVSMRLAGSVAGSVAGPLRDVQAAMAEVGRGSLDARCPVVSNDEIGEVAEGFNRMVAGLRERERLRDLFGRHVGHEVAQAALDRDGDVELGGEVREVAVVFVDVVASTRLVARRPPTEVVALLNAYFSLVVDVVEECGGWVNKFEGDAALCIFGAPTERPDAADDALRAARNLRERLATELVEADTGIGISAGPAVAGNIGTEARFEYTVIGAPVNEAARLSELAKQRPERLLASDAVLRRASAAEAGRWELGELVVLRGREVPTQLATPATAGVAGSRLS